MKIITTKFYDISTKRFLMSPQKTKSFFMKEAIGVGKEFYHMQPLSGPIPYLVEAVEEESTNKYIAKVRRIQKSHPLIEMF